MKARLPLLYERSVHTIQISTTSSDSEASHASTPLTEPLSVSKLALSPSTIDKITPLLNEIHLELQGRLNTRQDVLSAFREHLPPEPALVLPLYRWLIQSSAEDCWTTFRAMKIPPSFDIRESVLFTDQIMRKTISEDSHEDSTVGTDDSVALGARQPQYNKLRVYFPAISSPRQIEKLALLDAGANICCISKDLADELACEIFPPVDERHPELPRTINGDDLKCSGCTKLNLLWLESHKYSKARMRFYIVPGLQHAIQVHVLISAESAFEHGMWEAVRFCSNVDPEKLEETIPRVAAPTLLDRRTKRQKYDDQAELTRKRAAAALKEQQAEAQKRAEIQQLPSGTPGISPNNP